MKNKEPLKELIENLYPMNACILGEGYDNRLEYLKQLIDLEVLEFDSGTEFSTWTVPEEWVVKDAWIKDPKGKKIVSYKKQPLSLVVGSLPFKGKMSREELDKHLYYADDQPDTSPYVFKYYDKDWGFSVPKNLIKAREVTDEDCDKCEPELQVYVNIEGDEEAKKKKVKHVHRLKKGEYEVFIDTEYRPGKMKIGVHTIPPHGKKDIVYAPRRKEILLFAHLDHPFQANDNLSSVACLVDLAGKIKSDHTIKIIFCPETIGSIAYAHTQDISKVEFVIAVENCGNDHNILLQKSLDPEAKINRFTHCALQIMAKPYRKGGFRTLIGSDETVFNDPDIGIPGILLTRHPYKEYHTAYDTPDKINYEKIEEMGDLILKIISIADRDYVPKKNFKGPLMRSRYDMQSVAPQVNLNYDYLFYSIDGKRSLAELCADFEMNFDDISEKVNKIIEDGKITRIDPSEVAE